MKTKEQIEAINKEVKKACQNKSIAARRGNWERANH